MFPRMHASIYVSNLDRSVEFYNRFFRMSPEKVRPGYAKYHLESPALVFSLVENPQRVSGNFGHLGIQVDSLEALDRMKSDAQEDKVLSYEEQEVACCYAKQDKFWAVDPDGVQWEVYYFHEDVEYNDPAFAAADGQKEACCTPAFSVEALPASSDAGQSDQAGKDQFVKGGAKASAEPSSAVIESAHSRGEKNMSDFRGDNRMAEQQENSVETESEKADACCEPGCCGK